MERLGQGARLDPEVVAGTDLVVYVLWLVSLGMAIFSAVSLTRLPKA